MDITYCNDICAIGQAARDKFIEESNSAFDAVFDFKSFVVKCSQNCPYKVAQGETKTQ